MLNYLRHGKLVINKDLAEEGEWGADLERKINRSLMNAFGLRCLSDVPGRCQGCEESLKLGERTCGATSKRGPDWNATHKQSSCLPGTGLCISYALSHFTHATGRCCFPNDTELKSVSTAASLHWYPALCDLEQITQGHELFASSPISLKQ